jgi:hypothetical protein
MQWNPDPQIVELPDTAVPIKEVVKRMGYPNDSSIPDPIRTILNDALSLATGLMKPRAVYRICSIESDDLEAVAFKNIPFVLQSAQVARLLRNSDAAVFFAATVGPELDLEIKSCMDKGEATRGYMLDSIGSETAEAAADELHWNILQRLSQKEGCSVTPRFSPGYGDWPLTVQKDMIESCGGRLIGISVTPSSLMIPRKSISAVFGIYPLK